MSGFGTGPFGNFGFGIGVFAGQPEQPLKLVTSRKITTRGVNEQDSDGNYREMPDSHQRLWLALQLCEFPENVGLDYEAAVDAEIRDKASVLGSDITITSIDVVPYVNGGRITVNFTDNILNIPSSVVL